MFSRTDQGAAGLGLAAWVRDLTLEMGSRRWAVERWPNRACICLLTAYKKVLSPLLGNACRFYPSCSDYARQAFEQRGFFAACWLTLRRLAKCHPLHPGGYDPLDPPDDAPPTDDEAH